jgi:hypothetical protein
MSVGDFQVNLHGYLLSSRDGNAHQAEHAQRDRTSCVSTPFKEHEHQDGGQHQKKTNDETGFVQIGILHFLSPYKNDP